MTKANSLVLALILAAARSAAAGTTVSAVQLADNGHCAEAVPVLRTALAKAAKDLRRNLGIHLTRCAMTLNLADDAAATMRILLREFPDDPEVLYLAVHVYSDLSVQASRDLLRRAPRSPLVHELNAEALESQGKWDDAAVEYQQALKADPELPGVHFKLGRLYLSRPRTENTTASARREFTEELRINPKNAGAEYVLGELARQAEDWPQAIEHFTRASKLDPRFVEAYVGLGRCLLATHQDQAAVQPLEAAVKLQPLNPEAHFHLATAYRRIGRETDSEREINAQRQAEVQLQQSRDALHTALTGTPETPTSR
jgi:tetratricopeptide (TPR) repeat protein